MPRFDKNTSHEVLRKQAEKDLERIIKTTQRDAAGREYKWNGNFFESKPDDRGATWIKGIDSSVPGYWFSCDNITGTSSKGYDIVCRTTHFVFIYQDGEKLTCRKCNAECTIKIATTE